MKKIGLLISLFFGIGICTTTNAASLMEVYHQALFCDQIFKQAIFQRLSTKEGVPISLSALLPTLAGTLTPTITKTQASGSANITGNNTQKGYTINLTLTQTLYDFSKASNLSVALNTSKQADATLNAALQDLMVRVSKAYFDVLNAEDNLRYIIATRKAFAKQLDQVTQQYKVGLKTVTDVYTAQASYDRAQANYITAQNTVLVRREDLRVITGVYYPDLAKLSESFPLVAPCPANIECWVRTAERQNWSIRASQYAACAARENIKQQFAGHIPTLNAQGQYNINFNRTVASLDDSFIQRGTYQASAPTASVILNVPLVQGGLVIANTRRAQFDYQTAASQLEQQIRTTTNTARQSYLGIMSGISKVEADLQAIKSSISSVEGLEAAYQVGTGTLVDVLNQQEKVFQAQTVYAQDRYEYVNNLLTLKAAAGTLSECDLLAIDRWLIEGKVDNKIDNYESDIKYDKYETTAMAKHHHGLVKNQKHKV